MDEVNGRSRRASKDVLLSKIQDDQDYENLCYDHPPPHARRSSLPAIGQQPTHGQATGHLLPILDREPHTVISISPDSEDSGSPRASVSNAAKINNGRPQQGALTPIQDETLWYQTSTPSMMSNIYSSPASPTSGGPFPPINPSESHKSLQLSFSNPISSRRGVARSYSSMSQSSNPPHSMGKATGQGFSRSSNSMGRSANKQVSQSSGKVHSIPADMDHFTDV